MSNLFYLFCFTIITSSNTLHKQKFHFGAFCSKNREKHNNRTNCTDTLKKSATVQRIVHSL